MLAPNKTVNVMIKLLFFINQILLSSMVYNMIPGRRLGLTLLTLNNT